MAGIGGRTAQVLLACNRQIIKLACPEQALRLRVLARRRGVLGGSKWNRSPLAIFVSSPIEGRVVPEGPVKFISATQQSSPVFDNVYGFTVLKNATYNNIVYRPCVLVVGSYMCDMNCIHCLQAGTFSPYIIRNKSKVLALLREADKLGLHKVTFCIGESFYNIPFILPSKH